MREPLAFPKPSRLKSPGYLSWIRKQPCLIDHVVAQAHHTTSVGAFGSDFRAIPLCHRCHRELHRIGKASFEQKHRIDLAEEVLRLLEIFISARSEG